MSFAKNTFSNITINFYGGFGNNLQQVALALMYCKKYKKNLILKDHKHIKNFNYFGNSILKRFTHILILIKNTYNTYIFVGSF